MPQTVTLDKLHETRITLSRNPGEDVVLTAEYGVSTQANTFMQSPRIFSPNNLTVAQKNLLNTLWDLTFTACRNREAI